MARLDTLWYTRSGVPTAVGVAVQLGWFEQEFARDGIALRSIRDATEPLVRRSHYDHSQQNSFRQGGSVPAIWARASGRDTRLIGLTWTDESQVILTRPGSGISSVKDLKGRRLAVATRSDVVVDYWAATTERVYELALETVGLGLNDVELVRLPTDHSFDRPLEVSLLPADADALLRGDVDAIFNKGPRGLELAHALGAHVVFDTREVPEVRVRANHHSPRTLTVDGHLADHHPDIVVRILKQVLLASEWAILHPRDAVAYVARETNTQERWVRAAYGHHVNRHLSTDLDDVSIRALTEFIHFLYRRRYLPALVEVSAWLDPRPLVAARRLVARSGLSVAGASTEL